MARVQLPAVQNTAGRFVEGARMTNVTDAETGDAVVVYTDRTGSTTVTYPVISGPEGDFAAWTEANDVLIYYEAADDRYDNPRRESLVSWEAVEDHIATIPSINTSGVVTRNVKDDPYGAVGDGSTDDTEAIQSALNDAKQGSGAGDLTAGGIVFFPRGIYRITEPLYFGLSPVAPVNQAHPYTAMGASEGSVTTYNRGAVLLYDPPTGVGADPMVQIRNANKITFRDLAFAYLDTGFDGDLVNVDGGTGLGSSEDAIHVWFDHCSFTSEDSGTPFRTARSMLRFKKAIICAVERCHISGADQGIRLDDVSYVNNTVIYKNSFNFCNDTFIYIGSGDCESVHIDSNTFEAGTSTKAVRGGLAALGENNNLCYNLTISRNWYGDQSGSTEGIFGGLRAIDGAPCVIENNFMFRAGSSGWYLDLKVGPWIVRNNSFRGTGSVFGTSTADIISYGNDTASVNSIFSTLPAPANSFKSIEDFSTAISNHVGALTVTRGQANVAMPTTDEQVANRAMIIGYNGTGTPGASVPLIFNDQDDFLVMQGGTVSNTDGVQIRAGTTPAPKVRANGNGVAFNGQTPAARPDYTVTNPTTDRSLNVTADTTAQVAQVLGTLIDDLIAIGLLQ
jgi:hypothetical protein